MEIATDPATPPVYDLNALLAQMTADTFHDEFDTDTPVGNEVW